MLADSWHDFYNLFKQKVLSGGDWFDFYTSWMQFYGNNPNVCITSYEEMQQDLGAVIKRLSVYLKLNISDKDIITIVDKTSFANMSKDQAVNYSRFGADNSEDFKLHPFMRKVSCLPLLQH